MSKLVIYVDNFEFLEKREGGAGGGMGRSSGAPSKASGGDESIEEVPF